MLGLADRGSLQLETRPSGQGSGALISPTAAKAIAAARANGGFGRAEPYEEEDEEEESSSSSLDLEQVRAAPCPPRCERTSSTLRRTCRWNLALTCP